MSDKFLTIKEVAEKLRVSSRSVHRYINSGRLKAIKIGHWRIKKEDLKEFLEENSNLKKESKN